MGKRIIANTLHAVAGLIAGGICLYAGRNVLGHPIAENIALIGASIYCLFTAFLHFGFAVVEAGKADKLESEKK